MIVGPSGVGKSAALRTLMKGMEEEDGVKGELYIIDPKAVDKEALYGVLDGTTLEWTDGKLTKSSESQPFVQFVSHITISIQVSSQAYCVQSLLINVEKQIGVTGLYLTVM